MHILAYDKPCDAAHVFSSSLFSPMFVFTLLLIYQGRDKPGPESKNFDIDTNFHSSSLDFVVWA